MALGDAKAKSKGGGTAALGKVVGGAAGAGLGLLTGLVGAVGAAKAGMAVGGMVARKLGERKAREEAANVHRTLGDQVCVLQVVMREQAQ